MNNIFDALLNSPLFGISLSVMTYAVGYFIYKKINHPVANPLLIAIALAIIILQVFQIPIEQYQAGAEWISLFLAPATAMLALSVYQQREVLKKNFIPIFAGCMAGAVTSMSSVFLLCNLFGLTGDLTASLLPKSVTTPIAIAVSEMGGGISPIAVAAVIITGIAGAIFSPLLIRVFHIKNPVEQGVAIGAASHAMGTTKALELGEIQGAMSSISLCISGIITVVFALILYI